MVQIFLKVMQFRGMAILTFCMQFIFSASFNGNSEIWKGNFEFNYTEITELGRQGLFSTLKMCLASVSTILNHIKASPVL